MEKGSKVTRRDFIYLGIGGVLVASLPLARAISQTGAEKNERAFAPTPGNTLGPFYKKGAPRKERLFERSATGVPLLLVAGRVINTEGRKLSDARVEVFHADAEGEYDLQGYECRGEIPLSANGEYRYETVVPGGYGGRAQHIHYVINAPGHRRLVTQLYFENDPKFEGAPDRNFTRDNLVEHRELIRPVATVKQNNLTYSSVVFDIVLQSA